MTDHITFAVAPYRPKDAEQVAALFTAYRAFYGRSGDEERAAAYLAARLKGEDSIVLVARSGDQVIGFCQVYRSFSSLQLTTTWILNDLYVATDGRRVGAGRALVRRAIEEARHAGACAVVLETQIANAAARALYESLGFVATVEEGEFMHYRLELREGHRA